MTAREAVEGPGFSRGRKSFLKRPALALWLLIS